MLNSFVRVIDLLGIRFASAKTTGVVAIEAHMHAPLVPAIAQAFHRRAGIVAAFKVEASGTMLHSALLASPTGGRASPRITFDRMSLDSFSDAVANLKDEDQESAEYEVSSAPSEYEQG
jgi:hypothetical protein